MRTEYVMPSAGFESNLKNLRGTLAAEGIIISEASMSNLKKLAAGEMTCKDIVENIKMKYIQRS